MFNINWSCLKLKIHHKLFFPLSKLSKYSLQKRQAILAFLSLQKIYHQILLANSKQKLNFPSFFGRKHFKEMSTFVALTQPKPSRKTLPSNQTMNSSSLLALSCLLQKYKINKNAVISWWKVAHPTVQGQQLPSDSLSIRATVIP